MDGIIGTLPTDCYRGQHHVRRFVSWPFPSTCSFDLDLYIRYDLLVRLSDYSMLILGMQTTLFHFLHEMKTKSNHM